MSNTLSMRPARSETANFVLPFYWVGNPYEEGDAAFINLETGRVHATVWNDGTGAWHTTAFLTVIEALRVLWRYWDWYHLESLRAFPRLTFRLNYVKSAGQAISLAMYPHFPVVTATEG